MSTRYKATFLMHCGNCMVCHKSVFCVSITYSIILLEALRSYCNYGFERLLLLLLLLLLAAAAAAAAAAAVEVTTQV